MANTVKLLDIPKIIIHGLDTNKDNPYWLNMERVLRRNTEHSIVSDIELIQSTRIARESLGMGGCYFVLKQYFDVPPTHFIV